MSYSVTLTQRNIVYPKSREQILPSLLVLFIILFSVLYIVQANNVATDGYRIQEHKNKKAELQSENKNLELRLSEVRSLSFLEEKVEDLNMIKIEKVEYISPVSEVAAK